MLYRCSVRSCSHFAYRKAVPGLNVELPAVPSAAHDFACPIVDKLSCIGWSRRPRHRPFAKRASHVRAAIMQGVVASVHIKNANTLAVHLHNPPLARRQVGFADDDALALFRHAFTWLQGRYSPTTVPPHSAESAATSYRPHERSSQRRALSSQPAA
jgi:hypothetical protein